MLREPIVVLGEPGMGKTKLLKELSAKDGNVFCRAQQLINKPRPKTLLGDNERLVIDALDEVSAQSDGDAVDLVLRKLGELDYPPIHSQLPSGGLACCYLSTGDCRPI